jgi:SAM-dependent methyltransferase
VTPRDRWLAQAAGWAAWAETGDDGFSEFRPLLPPARGRALDLGCGEGRFTRALGDDGYDIVGTDLSAKLVRVAIERDPFRDYVVADAEALPFADASFDLVVAYNVLSCVQDLGTAIVEIGRVLMPGGRLCASVVHPLYTAGEAHGAAWTIGDDYLHERVHEERAERDGATLVFANVHRPLESYTRALEDAGLVIDALREPEWQVVPMFLHLRAVKT